MRTAFASAFAYVEYPSWSMVEGLSGIEAFKRKTRHC
jgi:hypothetical protein